MNALDRKFMNAGKSTKAARYLGVVAAAGLLSACVGDPIASAKVDPKSPIAAEVAKVASADRDYPSFGEIPPAPKDLRPVRVYGQRAKELEDERAQLDAATAPNTWTLGNTTSFAAGAHRDAGPDLGPPTNADTEAFAASVRKRATPPPPANK
jgi:hypothetical protein